MSTKHANCISSGVSGEFNAQKPSFPASILAASMALRIEKNTLVKIKFYNSNFGRSKFIKLIITMEKDKEAARQQLLILKLPMDSDYR